MSFELQTAVWTTVILFVLLMLQGGLIAVVQGLKWDLGSRDGAHEESPLQGRVARTAANHIEGMLLFLPLVMVAHLSDVSSTLTVWGAGLYLAGRIAYVPLYLLGVPVLRSIVWTVTIIGIALVGYEVFRAML